MTNQTPALFGQTLNFRFFSERSQVTSWSIDRDGYRLFVNHTTSNGSFRARISAMVDGYPSVIAGGEGPTVAAAETSLKAALQRLGVTI